MKGVLSYVSVAILLAWATYALTGLFASVPVALAAGLLNGLISLILLRNTLALHGLLAVLSPIGILLPLLALRHVAIGAELHVEPFGTVELLVCLFAYLVLLASTTGILAWDIYRLGYQPVPVAVMALLLCVCGALTGNIFYPLLAVLGQALWMLRWGSSNWFDHVTHALLVPVIIISLILRFF